MATRGTRAVVAALVLGGCVQAGSAPAAPQKAAEATTASTAAVSKIVFVGKGQACDCTKAKIVAASAALETVLGKQAGIPVERLEIDTQAAQVEPYRARKAMVALPALYFLDAGGQVLALLQGDITEAQVRGALGQARGSPLDGPAQNR